VLLLAKVESFFMISGRGAVIVPVWLSDLRVQVGDRVQLRSPNGRVKDTSIAGVELLKQTDGECRTAFLLSREVVITKEELGEGTEIWVTGAPKRRWWKMRFLGR
jgi:translation elongation factor EF-Tu-like GTPase